MFTWGTNVLDLGSNYILVYKYAGFFWLGFHWGAHLYKVDDGMNVLYEAGPSEAGVDSIGSLVPINDRLGWLVWAGLFLALLVCGG